MIPGVMLALAIASPNGGGAPGPVLGPVKPPAVYLIDSYLDPAPIETQVIETVRVGIGGRERLLHIVSYQRLSGGDPWMLVRDVGAFRPDFLLRGRPVDVELVLDAEPGARVRGTFRHIRGSHTLVINPHDLTVE